MPSLQDSIIQFEAPSNISLILATFWIATKVFPSTSRGQILIGQYGMTKAAHTEHNDFIDAFLVSVSQTLITRVLLEVDNISEGNKKNFYDFYSNLNNQEHFYRLNVNKRKAIWLVDSLSSFGRLEKDLLNERNHFHRSGFYCIIYTGREADLLETLRTIFTRLFRIYIINVNVLLTSGKTVYVYTYYPFTHIMCNSGEPFFHGIFGPATNYKYSQKIFFPKKLTNMWGCKMNVTTWTEPPFIRINYNNETGEVITLEGIEGMLIMLLAERMNFSIRIVEAPLKSAGNGTDPGAIKMLSDGLTNITVAGLIVDNTRQEVARASYSYLHVPLNLCIPIGKMMSPLERLIRPFKYTVWICLSSSLLIGIIIISALKAFGNRKVQEFVFGQGNRLPFTSLWSVFYGIPIARTLPRRNFARYLLAVWLLYTFVIRSAYLAQLFLILQDSRARNELTTVSETVQQNFTFYVYPIAIPILFGATSQQINIKSLSADPRTLIQLFRLLAKDENANIAVTLLGHVIRAYNQHPMNLNHQVNILRESIVQCPITVYMRKNSYLASEIDGMILNILSAGLIQKFEDLSLNQRSYVTTKAEAYDSFHLSLLIGLFFGHFVFLMMSTVVFLLELWSKHSPLTKMAIDFFNQ